MNILKTILLFACPMAFLRLYGGDGGDGGAADMRKQEEDRQRKVQQAVDAINARFGVGAGGGTGPTREQFITSRPKTLVNTIDMPTAAEEAPGFVMPQKPGIPAMAPRMENPGMGFLPGEEVFDEAGYNKALAEWQTGSTDAQRNKAERESMYADIANAVRDTAMRDVDRQFTTASRRNKFGLARSGLIGASVDAESGGELKTLYGEGRLKATQAGQSAGSELRGTDERTRQNLIGLAQSGLDTGTAASMAAGQMAAATDLARSNAAGASVGRLFDDLSQAYVTNQVTRARYPNGVPQSSPTSGYSTNVFSPSRYTGVAQR